MLFVFLFQPYKELQAKAKIQRPFETSDHEKVWDCRCERGGVVCHSQATLRNPLVVQLTNPKVRRVRCMEWHLQSWLKGTYHLFRHVTQCSSAYVRLGFRRTGCLGWECESSQWAAESRVKAYAPCCWLHRLTLWRRRWSCCSEVSLNEHTHRTITPAMKSDCQPSTVGNLKSPASGLWRLSSIRICNLISENEVWKLPRQRWIHFFQFT
jgi:hypothetical protein